MTKAQRHRIINLMSILNSQKISIYYDLFKSIDVTFSKEINQVTGLVPNQVYLKCVGDFWPCIVYSSSFEGAKVVVNLKSGILRKMERANNMVSLRFCFKTSEKGNPVAFFVNTKNMGHAPYGNSEDVAMFNLRFTQRPPDDLIEIMGRILDANVNSVKRRDERIVMTPDVIRKLNVLSKETAVFIQGVPRNVILRDLAFSGARVIMMGVAKFLLDKKASIRVDFDDPRESFLIEGIFEKAETVEGRKDLIVLALSFYENSLPMGYKLRINDYLSVIRADRGNLDKIDELPEKKKPAAAESAAEAPKAAAETDPLPLKESAEKAGKAAVDGGFDPGPPPA